MGRIIALCAMEWEALFSKTYEPYEEARSEMATAKCGLGRLTSETPPKRPLSDPLATAL